MTYIEPARQLPRYAASLDTPGRRLGLCIADTIVTFYVTATKAIVEAITSVVTGNYPQPLIKTPVICCPGHVIPEMSDMMKLHWPGDHAGDAWKQLQRAVGFASDCTRLQAVTPDSSHVSSERFQKLVEQVASESSHNIFEVPAHLQVLMLDKLRSQWAVDCEQKCLGKFLALIEAEKERR